MNKIEFFKKFQKFYAEVLKQKDIALHSYDDTQETKLISQNAFAHLESIQKTLKHLLNQQDVSTEMLYAMCAFVDEIFIHLPWSMQAEWKNALLEMHFFSSQMAGEIIFQRIEKLIKNYDSSQRDLAILYFLILTLGFRGKYQDYPEKIGVYIKIFYALIQKELPTKELYFFSKCYENTLDGPAQKGLPDIRTWCLSITTVVVLYVFATYVLWYNFVSDVYVFLK